MHQIEFTIFESLSKMPPDLVFEIRISKRVESRVDGPTEIGSAAQQQRQVPGQSMSGARINRGERFSREDPPLKWHPDFCSQ